jgi:hypothetical protein
VPLPRVGIVMILIRPETCDLKNQAPDLAAIKRKQLPLPTSCDSQFVQEFGVAFGNR